MKNLFKSMMLVAVAAMGFTACSNDKTADVAPDMEQKMVTMTITAEDATRTFLTENGTEVNFGWNEEGEVIYGMEIADAFTGVASTSYALTDGKAAFTFENAFPAEVEATEFTYNAIYPEANRVKNENTNVAEFKLRTQAAQAPTATSYDPAADLMIAKQVVVNARPENLSMQFQRIVALGKMTFTNLDTESTIEQVTFETTNNLSGLIKADLTTGTVAYEPYSEGKKVLTLTYAEPVAKTDPIYFVTLPAELSESFKVVVATTDGCTFTREVDLATAGKTLAFTAGNLSAFTVNMATAEKVEPASDVYTLLTDASKLNIGDKIVITNSAVAGDFYALSTTQANNNRTAKAITIKDVDGVMTLKNNAEMAVLTVGENNGKWTLYDPANKGYLYASSTSANRLQTYTYTEGEFNERATWTIEVAATGVATIKAAGTEARHWMRYNYNNGSPMFNCYTSDQSDVYIYLNDCGTGEVPAPAPVLTVTPTELSFKAAGGSNSFTATLANSEEEIVVTEEADWLDVTNEGTTYTVAAAAYDNTEEDRTATITVTAGELTQTVTVTQAKYVDPNAEEPSTGEEVTVTLSCLFEDHDVSSWDNNYNTARTLTFDVAEIKFSGASKQASTITDCPVVKNQTVDVVMTNNAKITAVTYTCKQWGSKNQTMKLYYSTDGSSFTEYTTGVTWSNFVLTCPSLPEGTVAVRAKGTNSSYQIGIQSAIITYAN